MYPTVGGVELDRCRSAAHHGVRLTMLRVAEGEVIVAAAKPVAEEGPQRRAEENVAPPGPRVEKPVGSAVFLIAEQRRRDYLVSRVRRQVDL